LTLKYKVTSSATNSCRTNLGSAKHCDNRVEEGNSLIASSSAEPCWILQRKKWKFVYFCRSFRKIK